MIVNIAALILILGITFLHSIFGLFSGLINVFCSVVSAVVALGAYEWAGNLATSQFGVNPSYSAPCALIVLYLVTHALLRFGADTALRGNVRLPRSADIAGGVACGFVNAQITVGILVLSFLMLPFGGRVAMFSRVERDADNTKESFNGGERIVFHENDIWLNPDRFVTWIVNTLSAGSLQQADQRSFAQVYPDFSEWVFWSGNTVQRESATAPYRTEGDGNAGLKVESWWIQKSELDARYRPVLPTRKEPEPAYSAFTYRAESGDKLIGMRLNLDKSAADREKGSAYHRFRPSMIRLVGTVHGQPRQYVPDVLGGADDKIQGALRVVDIDNNFAIAAAGTTQIDAFFSVDPDFEPEFVEYRRFARAEMPAEPAKGPPGSEIEVAARETEERGPQINRAGFVSTIVRPSGDLPDLPFPLAQDKVQSANATLRGEALVSGRISGRKSELQADQGASVRRLQAPEGFRICQIRFKPRQAQSLPGQVFNFAASVANQYVLEDKRANQYELKGYYAIVKRDGQEYFELYFTGPPDSPEAQSFRGLLDFKDIQRRELTADDDAVLSLIFLVPPDQTVYKLRTNSGQEVTGFDYQMRTQD